jgi:thiol-disulfide isomerase/thioredoxin
VRRISLLFLALVAACTSSSGASKYHLPSSQAAQGSLVPVADRVAAPPLSGVSLEGRQLSLRDFRGSAVALNVWGSWCGPCRNEAPALKSVSDELAGQGVQFLGLDIRDSRDKAIGFERSFGITYPSIEDSDGSLLAPFDVLPPTGVPVTALIDRHGRVAGRIVGVASYTPLKQALSALAREP